MIYNIPTQQISGILLTNNSYQVTIYFCSSNNSVNPYVTGSSPVARATFYTVLLKGGFSLDFQAFSQFDNTGYKICYFSGIIELHNKKG